MDWKNLLVDLKLYWARDFEEKPERGLHVVHINDLEFDVPAAQIMERIKHETQRDRLQQFFSVSSNGSMSPGLSQALMLSAALAPIFFVGISHRLVSHAHHRFKTANQLTVYETRFRASRRSTDYVIVKTSKEALMYATKFTGFNTLMVLTSNAVAASRGKSAVGNYVIGGAVAGFILKLNLGLLGGLSASVLGALLGLIGGLAVMAYLRTVGEERIPLLWQSYERQHYIQTAEWLAEETFEKYQRGQVALSPREAS